MNNEKATSLLPRIISLMQDRKRWLAFTAIVVLLGALWTAASAMPGSESLIKTNENPKEGFLAPDFNLDTLDGDSVTLSALRGRVVMIVLWTSWCPSCRTEMPLLQAIYEGFSADDLVVLGVNITDIDSATDAYDLITELGLTFPIVFDFKGEVAELYNMHALPMTFFIDPQGVIRKAIVGGSLTEESIQTIVMDLLEDS